MDTCSYQLRGSLCGADIPSRFAWRVEVWLIFEGASSINTSSCDSSSPLRPTEWQPIKRNTSCSRIKLRHELHICLPPELLLRGFQQEASYLTYNGAVYCDSVPFQKLINQIHQLILHLYIKHTRAEGNYPRTQTNPLSK